MQMMQLNDCAQLLKARDNYLIITHRRPDGDTIGSAGALCVLLQAMGKTAHIFPNPEFTETYIQYVIPFLANDDFVPDTIVSVDTASEDLFPYGFSGNVDLSIDHHPSNTGYAKNTIVWAHCAACGELMLELAKELRAELTKELAEFLYVAIATDTGCFCYGNTTSDTFRAAAELIDCGADNGAINKRLFRTSSKERLALEGLIFSSLETYREGRISVATVTLDMMKKSGATEDDCDDIASLAGRVAGSNVSVTIKEKEKNLSKISLRTSRNVDASAICSKFGGGGHAMAAGCTIERGYDEAKSMLLDAIYEVMG